MKRRLIAALAAGVLAASVGGSALATLPVEPNENAKSQDNCVGVFNSRV